MKHKYELFVYASEHATHTLFQCEARTNGEMVFCATHDSIEDLATTETSKASLFPRGKGNERAYFVNEIPEERVCEKEVVYRNLAPKELGVIKASFNRRFPRLSFD